MARSHPELVEEGSGSSRGREEISLGSRNRGRLVIAREDQLISDCGNSGSHPQPLSLKRGESAKRRGEFVGARDDSGRYGRVAVAVGGN